MSKKYKKSIFWFRRDLRLEDNAGLYNALKFSDEVIPIFIFDKQILSKLEDKEDPRVQFIHETISKMKSALLEIGSDLHVFYGNPEEVWEEITENIKPNAVFTNRDYEPYAKERDSRIAKIVAKVNADFLDFKDHVIFENKEVRKDDGNMYVVFTPYKRRWLARLNSKGTNASSYYFKPYPCKKYYPYFSKLSATNFISLDEMGFLPSSIKIPSKKVAQGIIRQYDEQRDFPAIDGTSKLGIHFRFGTVSIREKARKAIKLNQTYLSELVWRDFYSNILDNYPKVVDSPFRDKYDRIPWRFNDKEFQAWCEGKTGYPMVDAGMRELNATGHMHNRVRMVVASFLTKHLLMDWRLGEAYFAKKLLDFDLASNNGGWQWAAGCGTDAAPYFRIFNPTSQMDKFDKKRIYIKKWIPEFDTDNYPSPIVEHKEARERCLATYKAALNP